MKISLIVTTYKWEEALDLVLRSIARQSELPDEILVADDGSGPETAVLVEGWREQLPIPVRHIWQEDAGFRASRIRNRAIAAAVHEYLLLVDGDMVLHRHFVADHKNAARRGTFIQGARLLTDSETSSRMIREGILDLSFRSGGVQRRRHLLRIPLLSRLIHRKTHSKLNGVRSSNQGCWREDLLRVNGFDERMIGWGREDNEIAARLQHTGVSRRNLRFGGLAIHLWHRVRTPEGMNPNDRFLRDTIETRATRCPIGIDAHLGDS